MSYEKYFNILHFPNLQKVIVHLPKHKGCYLIRVEDNCMAAVGTGEVLLLVAQSSRECQNVHKWHLHE